MSLRFFKPNWSNWQKAILAAFTASSIVSKMPMSRSGAGECPDDEAGADAPTRPVRSATIRCAISSISCSERLAMASILSILLRAADFPRVHDRHDNGVAGAIFGREGLAGRTARGHEHQFARADAHSVDRHDL